MKTAMKTLLLGFFISGSMFAQSLNPWGEVTRVPITPTFYKSKTDPNHHHVWVVSPTDPKHIHAVLVFLPGFLPTFGYIVYKSLVEYLAKLGIAVLVPIYAFDEHYGTTKALKSAIKLDASGYNSQTLAQTTHALLNDALEDHDLNQYPLFMYGHSLGALIAFPMMEMDLGHRSKGFMLDGVPEATALKNKYNYLQHPIKLQVPISILNYEHDVMCETTNQIAYDFISSPYKQKINIFGPSDNPKQANHFSSMTDSCDYKGFKMFRNFVLKETKKLHTYPPTIGSNIVDDYGLKTLLPAMVLSEDKRKEFKSAREYLYGDLVRLIHQNGKLLRSRSLDFTQK